MEEGVEGGNTRKMQRKARLKKNGREVVGFNTRQTGNKSDGDYFPDDHGRLNWDNILGNFACQCFRFHSEDAGLVL